MTRFPNIVGAALLPLLFAAPALAQTGRWKQDGDATAYVPAWLGASDRAATLGTLDALLAILKRDPALAQPTGFDVVVKRSLVFPTSAEWSRPHPVPAGIVGFAIPYGRDAAGRPVPGHEGPGFSVKLNDLSCAFGESPVFAHDAEGDLLRAPKPDGSVHGHPRYETGCVWVTHVARPIALPVPRERVVRLRLAEMRAQQARAESIAVPNGNAQFAAFRAQTVAQWKAKADSLAAELAAMSPAERRAPAYVNPFGAARASHLTTPDDPAAIALVTINPQYFDPSLPVSAPQGIAVRFSGVIQSRFASDALVTAFTRALDQLDWNALGALLRP